MLFRKKLHQFCNVVFETKRHLSIDGLLVPKFENLLVVLDGPEGKRLIGAHNIVTNQGDIYYAQRSAVETPTLAFNSLYFSTATWSPAPSKTSNSDDLASVISGSESAVDGTYPRTNDPDSDNSATAAADVVTWRFSYAAADFTATGIVSGAVSTAGVTSWGAGGGVDQVLTAFSITSFDKTASDTLKFFVNHTVTGT